MKFAFAFAALLLAGSAVAGPRLPAGKKCSAGTYSGGGMCTADKPDGGCKSLSEKCNDGSDNRCACSLVPIKAVVAPGGTPTPDGDGALPR